LAPSSAQRAASAHRSSATLHRPGSPRPVLRVTALPQAPSVPPPSERGLASDRREYTPHARLRLTRRGRLALLISAIALLFTAFSVGQVMSNAAGPGPSAPSTHTVVVAPGDTAWSIARQAMPHLDGRDAVDRLLAMNHSDGNIRVGQTLTVPGS
jgi:hypothetical protein